MAPKKFTPEFKVEVVRAVISSSRTVTDVAREYGVGPETLRGWVNVYVAGHAGDEPELSESEPAELARLRKENRELKAEKEFLGKAAPSSRRSTGERQVRVHPW